MTDLLGNPIFTKNDDLPPLHRERLLDVAAASTPLHIRISRPMPFGASLRAAGVCYRFWVPDWESISVEIVDEKGRERVLKTTRDEDGYQNAHDDQGRAGDRYRLRLPNGECYPDPASRAQAADVTGYSIVVNPQAYAWRHHQWQRPSFRDLIIYELHVGTFTPEGTFAAVIGKLQALKELGINAIELMPIADFPGARNWGYDGVLLYAPARAYGTPDDLRALVDAAHAHGIAVILDVVYNHVGPDGSCLAALAPQFFNEARQTPWGASFNFDGPDSGPVREYFAWNPVYWINEFQMDGVRLDATHAILDASPTHLLAEISDRVHALGGYVIAEDERNEVRLVEPRSEGGYGLDAVWADDFHHTVRVSQTNEQHAYLQHFSGTLEETLDTLACGWRFRGQLPLRNGNTRGTECSHVPPERLIHCISNHDQVGNQAFGTRVSSHISPDSFRAISVLLCLTPYTPMIFMGQEWGASNPFLYFTDHNPGLGRLITEGRRREFADFPEFSNNGKIEDVPDPQDERTFINSKLNWAEIEQQPHSHIRDLYASCLRLRQSESAFRPKDRSTWRVHQLAADLGCIRYDATDAAYLLLFHLWPDGGPITIELSHLPVRPNEKNAQIILSSAAKSFGGLKDIASDDVHTFHFDQPETLLLRVEKA